MGCPCIDSPRLVNCLVQATQLAGMPAPSGDSKLELHIRRAAAHCLRGMAKHTPGLAQHLVDGSILPAAVGCLALSDPELQEAAAWILGNIAGETMMPAAASTRQQS